MNQPTVVLPFVVSYKLDDTSADELFLSGLTVLCDAAIPEAHLSSVSEGTRVLVLLSNGKKYMGNIGKFHFKRERGVAIGKLEIQRATK